DEIGPALEAGQAEGLAAERGELALGHGTHRRGEGCRGGILAGELLEGDDDQHGEQGEWNDRQPAFHGVFSFRGSMTSSFRRAWTSRRTDQTTRPPSTRAAIP